MWTTTAAGIAIGDYDGDGWKDIAVMQSLWPGYSPYDIHILQNGGAGSGMSFSIQGPFPHGPWTLGTAADIDGNGCDDLVTVGFGEVRVNLGHPQMIVQAPIILSQVWGATGPYTMSASDFDGDGFLDLTWYRMQNFQNSLNFRLYVMLNGPTGLRVQPLEFDYSASLPATAESSLCVADLDGDSDPDILISRPSPPYTPGTPMPLQIGIAWNEAVTGPGSAGSFGFPSQAVGSAALGNGAFAIGLSGAAPGAPAALGLSLGPGAYGAPPAAIWLDLSPGQLILPDLASGLGAFVTDASGLATFNLPIPNDPAVQGASFYTQWAIADPLGLFTINGIPFALSEARKIVAW